MAGGLREQASVHIYSGNFNIKGMEKEDFDMIVETTKSVGESQSWMFLISLRRREKCWKR